MMVCGTLAGNMRPYQPLYPKPASPLSASMRNADGNAGRGRSSGQQKKLQGHSPALIRCAIPSDISGVTPLIS